MKITQIVQSTDIFPLNMNTIMRTGKEKLILQREGLQFFNI